MEEKKIEIDDKTSDLAKILTESKTLSQAKLKADILGIDLNEAFKRKIKEDLDMDLRLDLFYD